MVFARQIEAETLDALDPHDAQAAHSRRDLQRINRIMGSSYFVAQALTRLWPRADGQPLQILELGAGDGTLLLRAQRDLADLGPVRLTVLDRFPIVSAQTLASYRSNGWTVTALSAELDAWMAAPEPACAFDAIVTNLFLHHFGADQLRALFAVVMRRTTLFFAAEPLRGTFPLWASHLVGAIGANQVTRNDAVLSVRAGFRERELSALWPASDQWKVIEQRRGLFTHCLTAQHVDAPVRAV